MDGPKVMFTILGIPVTETVTNAWIIMAVIMAGCFYMTNNLQKVPKGRQVVAEAIVKGLYNLVEETMGKGREAFAPYIGTLFTFSFLGSLSSMFGLRPMTGDYNTTLGWALVTFFMVQYNGIKSKKLSGYLKGFAEPIPVILPLNIVSELANPVSLSFRHFGNIAAGMIITSLLYSALAGLTSMVFGGLTIPILQLGLPAFLSIYFDIFTAALQAFIFSMLTMAFVSGAME